MRNHLRKLFLILICIMGFTTATTPASALALNCEDSRVVAQASGVRLVTTGIVNESGQTTCNADLPEVCLGIGPQPLAAGGVITAPQACHNLNLVLEDPHQSPVGVCAELAPSMLVPCRSLD